MVAKARYIKNRPDLPGPPYTAPTDATPPPPPVIVGEPEFTLVPGGAPGEQAAPEDVGEAPSDPGHRVGRTRNPDTALVEGGAPVGSPDEPVRKRRSKPRSARSQEAEAGEAES